MASRRDCESLRDHIVELRMATVTADRDPHRRALDAALGDFVDTCADSRTRADLQCALAARDASALSSCSTEGAR